MNHQFNALETTRKALVNEFQLNFYRILFGANSTDRSDTLQFSSQIVYFFLKDNRNKNQTGSDGKMSMKRHRLGFGFLGHGKSAEVKENGQSRAVLRQMDK